MTRWQKIRPFVAGTVASLLVADLVGHAYYRLTKGKALWWDENAFNIFRIRPFTTRVPDDRVVTMKRPFSSGWLEVDGNGFRVGSGAYEGKPRTVVFIGDSVPFGWDVPGDRTVPAHFARLLDTNGKAETTGVINAAIPSYSMYQAVKRYFMEVHGRFSVSAVVLQTWDPATQLSRQGKAWTRNMNWSTGNSALSPAQYLLIEQTRAIQYSSLLYYGFQSYFRFNVTGPNLSPDDAETKARFIDENIRTLRELGDELEKRGIALYLLPGNPAAGFVDPGPVLTALGWLNESVESYAAHAKRAHYVDIVRRFDEVGRKGLFIDECCHLSDAGAALEARTVYEEMSRNGDLR